MCDVSIIIPTRDRGDLLAVTLRSALAQRDVRFEVIVVDDGSTARVPGDDDPRVQVLRTDRSTGVGAARNRGIAASRGAWVAFCDDDDLWAPDKLARQLAAAEDAHAGWAYAGSVTIDAGGRVIGGHPPDDPARVMVDLPRRCAVPAGSSNVVVRTDVLTSAGGFDPGLRHVGDWDLWLRLASQGPPAWVPAPLVAYRMHTRNQTRDVAGWEAELDILNRRYGLTVDRGDTLRWVAWSHVVAGARGDALRVFARAAARGAARPVAGDLVGILGTRVRGRLGLRRRSGGGHDAWQAEARRWLWDLAVA